MIPLQTHFPSYISTRNPTKYRGPQEGYQTRAQEAITYGLEQVKNTEKNQERLETLFRDLCTEFGRRRNEIAVEQGTANAQRFGNQRVVKITGPRIAITPLTRDSEYEAYNDRILRLVQTELNQLEHTKKQFLKTTFRKEEQAFGRSSVFEGEILSAETLKERKWDHLPSLEEFQAIDWGSVDITGQSRIQIVENGNAMERLKKVAPKLYERMKMAMLGIELNAHFPSPKKIDLPFGGHIFEGNTENLKCLFFLGKSRLEINQKQYAISSYYTWLYTNYTEDPIDRMVRCSTILLVHQDPFLIEETLPEIAKFFADAVLWDGKEMTDLQEKIAKFRYLFAHTTPFSRGSASIAEWFEQILYQFHGFEVDYNNEMMIDLEAFSSPLWSDFIAKYPDMIRVIRTARQGDCIL